MSCQSRSRWKTALRSVVLGGGCLFLSACGAEPAPTVDMPAYGTGQATVPAETPAHHTESTEALPNSGEPTLAPPQEDDSAAQANTGDTDANGSGSGHAASPESDEPVASEADSDDPALAGPASGSEQPERFTPPAPPPPEEAPYPDLVRLGPDWNLWVNKDQTQVVMVAEVVRQNGPLEMFLCLKGTKEHESILAVRSTARAIHAGLLAINAQPGTPARFDGTFHPATGQEIKVTVRWTDADGKEQTADARDWVRNDEENKALAEGWVFGGSGSWKDERTGEEHYMAEDGDVICVSNFPTAMMDLKIESSQSDSQRLFEAYEERIPPKGTKVVVILEAVPGTEPKPGPEAQPDTEAGDPAEEGQPPANTPAERP